jgi:hypothetical protein
MCASGRARALCNAATTVPWYPNDIYRGVHQGPMTEPTDELDKKIYHILSYGEKRQSEIVKLLKSDRSGKTIRSHLKYLSDNKDWMMRSKSESGNAVYYSREGETKDPFRPKPMANPDIVDANFYDIERRLGLFSQHRGVQSSPDTFINNIKDLLELAVYYSKLLYNSDIANRFFDIFDVMVDELLELEIEDPTEEVARPFHAYKLFFELVKELYYNWEKGYGFQEYHRMLKVRLHELEDKVLQIPQEMRIQFQELALITNVELGKEYYKYLVGSGVYQMEVLLEKGFYTYDCRNEINEFIDDIHKVASFDKYQSSSLKDDPTEIISEVRRLYKNSN